MSTRRIGLVGCVKAKVHTARPAQDLYVSDLFRGRRAFVERSCDEWWIISAKYGLVHPLEILDYYDETLNDAGRSAKRRWSDDVLRAIDERIVPRPGDVFELHAGSEYRDFGLVEGVADRGCVVENPTEGMRIGEQLRFYSEARRRAP